MNSGSKRCRIATIYIAIMLTATILTLSAIRLTPSALAGPSFLSGWSYRKSYTVGPVAGAGVGYQVEIFVYSGVGSDSEQSVYLNGKGLPNYGDVRFTASDGVTPLSYWIQEVDSDHAIFWVKITDDLGSAASTIYMYYGNTSASTTSNGDNTFIFFDNFDESILNLSKWTVGGGSPFVSGGELVLLGTTGDRALIDSNVNFGVNTAVHTSARLSDASSYLVHFCSMRQSGTFTYRAGDLYSEGTNYATYQTVDGNYTTLISVALNDPTSSHTYMATWTPSGSSIYEDDVLQGTVTTNIPSVDQGAYFFGSAYANNDGYVNWCFVSKWVDSAPLIGSWGSEESAMAPPALTMTPAAVTCRKLGEMFTVKVNLTDPSNAKSFAFEIDFNTTLLDYTSIAWNQWGAGTISVDEANGVIVGSTSGTPVTGKVLLVSITFTAACRHIWRNEATMPGWVNIQSGSILIQRANLTYPSSPDLRYVNGGISQIVVGPGVAYTWNPIKGDVNLDGKIDIYDIVSLGNYLNVKQGDPMWTAASKYDLTNGSIKEIDILDIIIVASNYGYTYNP